MPDWSEFEGSRKAEPTPDEFAIKCSAVFSTGHGADLLKMFRAMTIEKALPEGANENALRELEAKRRFVRMIETATERGAKQAAGPRPA